MTEARKLDTNMMMLKTQKKGLSFRPEFKDHIKNTVIRQPYRLFITSYRRQLSVDIKMKNFKIKTSISVLNFLF